MGLTIKELQETIIAKDAEIENLKAGILAPDDQVSELKATIVAKDAEIIDLKAQVTDATRLIEQQHEQLSKEETISDVTLVTYDKKKYRVTTPVINAAGVSVTAADLKDNKELIEKLVKSQSSVLELVTKD